MTALDTCPKCGVREGAFHRRECGDGIIAIRPCCGTPLWRDDPSPHLPHCYEWGEGPRLAGYQPIYPNSPSFGRDVWEGLR